MWLPDDGFLCEPKHVEAAFIILTLVKHWMWLPDDGFLCESKHVEAAFIILTILII